jgi:hypothetical protein
VPLGDHLHHVEQRVGVVTKSDNRGCVIFADDRFSGKCGRVVVFA